MMSLGLNAEWTVDWGGVHDTWRMVTDTKHKDDERESERAAAAACAGDLSGDLVRSPIYRACRKPPHGRDSHMESKAKCNSNTTLVISGSFVHLEVASEREYTRACLSSKTLSSALGYGYGMGAVLAMLVEGFPGWRFILREGGGERERGMERERGSARRDARSARPESARMEAR